MVYVSGFPQHGRVGHQFSLLFAARWFATRYGLQYCHAPFVDGATWSDRAAQWNPVLGLAQGVPSLQDFCHTRPVVQIMRPLLPRAQDAVRTFTLAQFDQLAAGIPDEWLALFPGYGMLWYNAYAWDPQTFGETCRWFQHQIQAAPGWQAVPNCLQTAPGKLSVAAYVRTGGAREDMSNCFVHAAQFFEALETLRKLFGPRLLVPQIFTQGPLELFTAPGWRNTHIHVCDDEYPATFSAVKACVDADIFLGSIGGTNSLIRTLRHQRRLSVGFCDRVRFNYPDGPNADSSGKFVLDGFEHLLPAT